MNEATGKVEQVCSVHGLDKRFGATHAVADISLTFAPGRVHCLLGENGAGKSTIGKMLGGIYTPDRGTILFGGTPIPPGNMRAARAAGIALVFQELSLAPDLSVRDNMCLGVQPRRHPFRWRSKRAETALCWRILDQLGLFLPLEAVVGRLPLGHQQLVEIAKALVSQPRLVVLDEPTAMLGGVDRDRLFKTICRLRNSGVAFVLITHHLDEVLMIGDDVSVLKDGRLVGSFPVTPDSTAAQIGGWLTGRRDAPALHASAASTSAKTAAKEPVDPVLTIEGIAGQLGSPKEITVEAGRIVALYGVVGCGREALTRSVVGLARSGGNLRLRLRGRAYAPQSPAAAFKQGVTYLPAGRAASGILPTRSIRENIMLRQLGGRLGLLPLRATERRRAAGELERFGTRLRHLDDLITSLSGGNQQKVLLGRSIGAGGALLVLEDPTVGVDIGAKAEIHAILRREVEKGLAVLLVSSDLTETIALADVLYTMFDGRLVTRYDAPLSRYECDIVRDVVGGASGNADFASEEVLHGVA